MTDPEEEYYGAPISVGADAVEGLLRGLNPAQAEAVTHGEGPLLVLAGAGSGKTRVLTHRVAYLLATGMARPGEILAITFTNKAAGEMKERVASLVGAASRVMWVMTFHSACARILRQHADRLGYKRGFTIYDEADSRRMVKRCMDELGIDPKRFPPRSIKGQISGAKNRLRDAETMREEQGSFFEETVADVYSLYEKRMHEANAMDFDDLLVRTVNLFELFADLRERYARNFRHVLVDEYQDTNRVQYRMLQLLSGEHGNLFVVGDDAQSVYGFRAADIRNILDFEEDFPDALTVKLEQNYRSTGVILDAANGLISHNRDQMEKRLWTAADRGAPVTIAELGDEHEEARWVAGEIDRLVEEEGIGRDEVAVFYRTNAQSRVLEDTLVRFDVPYQVIGGTKFYERAEIKDAIAYLRVLANPDDSVSLARILNSPRRGIGSTSEGRLLAWANTTGVSPLEAIISVERVNGLGAAAVKAIGRFGEMIASLTERAEQRGPIAELLESTLSESGYIEALEAERTIEAEGRVENLNELIGMAGEFDANRVLEGESEISPLEEFLEQISLINEQDKLVDDETLVTLMTLHNAKGLEYKAVFMIGCEDGVFPHSRSIDEGNLEEERRLCYVGLTRAREFLTLTHARRRNLFGSQGTGIPSRFLGEIPSELVERHSTGPAADGLGEQRPLLQRCLRAARLGARPGARARGRRRRHPRLVRRGRRDLRRAGERRRDPLRPRRRRAQADGRLRTDSKSKLSAEVIDGKAIAADLRGRVADVVARRTAAGERSPGLATVLVGSDPASHVYVGNKLKACEQAGIRSIHHELPADVAQSELIELVAGLDADPEVDGILVQMPLPTGLDPDLVLAQISPAKDVDGLTPANAGLLAQGRLGLAEALDLEPREAPVGLIPCTPAGIVEILSRCGVELEGAEAVIVGRSTLVGRPLAGLLLNANATVTTCHSRTRDLGGSAAARTCSSRRSDDRG